MATVLAVCTGNLCRSPTAELLLQAYLAPFAQVHSAGVNAAQGQRIPTPMLQLLDGVGLNGDDHRAVQYTPAMARGADLILAMAARHRARLVHETPAALRTTVLFDEVVHAARSNAELDGTTPAERILAIPRAVTMIRPELTARGVTDVPDPFGASSEHYAEAFEIIRSGVVDISTWIGTSAP